MSLSSAQKLLIEETISKTINNKLDNYSPETNEMPFHYRLIGKDKMYLYSFIQSLNTSFGISIFGSVAKIIAQSNFDVSLQKSLGPELSKEADNAINRIMNDLTVGEVSANYASEFQLIKNVCRTGSPLQVKSRKVDIYLQGKDHSCFAIDIKTVKPNIASFEDHKHTLLKWMACVLYDSPDTKICSFIAMPYNPYHPKPYKRWTLSGMLDIEKQLQVGEEFWNFLAGGDDIYDELLDCFERVGQKLRVRLDEYFSRFS